MGRYFSGDINGKFWFGTQSSDAADRFGVTGYKPEYLEYYFDKDEHLEGVEKEIKNIEEGLGEKLAVIQEFFKGKLSYSSSDLHEAGITDDELSEYADLELGIQIRDCLVESGYCSFEAEL
jgi:hypothetical protein